jgi:dihydropyrimidinase
MSFSNWPRYTILRGRVVWAEGELLGTPQDGEYLKRKASQLTTAAMKSIANYKRRVATWLYK